jgi:excisionase family DNA binding protein
MIEKFLTTEQVANILQVHPFTILKYIKEGKLKGIKLGRVYRIQESDMVEFLEERSAGKKKVEIVETNEVDDDEDNFNPEYDLKPPSKKDNDEDHYHII